MSDTEAARDLMRLKQMEERRALAKKLGIAPVPIPPMLPDEGRREYCERIGKLGERLVLGIKSRVAP